MTHTFATIAAAELTRRLTHYATLVAQGNMDKATANHRYLALQTALWMDSGGDPPKTLTTPEESREEIQRWIREINRNATVQSMHEDGRRVALLQQFLDNTKPITAAPAQLKLI
jgi:hypothetical protein